METITTIRQNISSEQARLIVDSVSADYSTQVLKKIYYPYHWFFYNCTVKMLFRERSFKASCLVNLRDSEAATSDLFDREDVSADSENVLPCAVAGEEAKEIAQSYIIHTARHKMKSLVIPQMELLEQARVYKPFWLIKCENRKRTSFRVLLDGVTGKFQILSVKEEKS